ncbi:Gfo/Idh/MocA family protein [Telmatospirillum siberiense]|uniref:Gfo/Idh/MocA family oxidoreductase n=1 Tax=Telmatospirillum siberiense TaxID=382514 RepID=A0A2N3PUR0_9PROT|nr:Gfo/Idh/MocA family oxidoreductase [Telmatospirillum siberiense]PKU24133.1 gfo/Idh/MocA family oxidoreductase [Telmatospirillum siberiense]
MAHRIRWGVMGCARIARMQVVPAIGRCANATLQAVASRDQGKLTEFRNLFGEFTAHSTYQALIDDPSVDAIYLPLPNSMHWEWAIKAMHKGKHVLCEKPLALNAGEAEKMVRTARECGVRLMEAFMYRYTDRTKKIVEVLDSGVLGEIRCINSTFRFFLDRENTIKENPELGGGALYDVGCYPLNLIGLVTREEPVSVVVECAKSHGVDVNLSAILRYPSGLIASLHCGLNAFGRISSEITGSKGLLLVPDTFLDNAGQIQLVTDKGTEMIVVAESDRYAAEITDFSTAILEKREPALSLDESLRNMRVLERLVAARDKIR